ncbi:MAG: 3-deoxy-7-phosphoheptulonate synthase [Anaeroplasmataceae bacterium]|nr:3-deoxy-7-phosphoheptulonate synthase [Anaeroplasmataceae bacterium]
MIIKMKDSISNKEYQNILEYFKSRNLEIKDASSGDVKVIGIIGDTSKIMDNDVYALPGVDTITRIQVPYKKASKAFHPEPTVIEVCGVKIGGDHFTVMAGPCSVEDHDQIVSVANSVKESGAHILRGGAYKPRTSPYAFQGLELEGLDLLMEARAETRLPIITEIQSEDLIERFVQDVDIIQVGARNMQNFHLLKALGKIDKPILLKRGLSATIEEWLMAAEYILAGGNEKVILCERGIRTFEKYTRNTLDLSAVLAVKELSHLPVIVDPSHAAGKWSMVEDLSKAALAVGADGIIVEVHNNPECALCDGAQSLKPKRFDSMMKQLRLIAPIVGKKIEE